MFDLCIAVCRLPSFGTTLHLDATISSRHGCRELRLIIVVLVFGYFLCFSELHNFGVNRTQVQRIVLMASQGGSCVPDLLPSQGGSGSFNLSLLDPFTGRIDTTGPLDFDASANEASA